MFNLSIQEVQSHPEDYLYIFASDKFLSKMGTKAAMIIRQKKANQDKIIRLCAKNAGKDYSEYTDAIRQGFLNIYGITPAEVLVKLAEGETVAGKNWKEGVYGVGALKEWRFTQKTASGESVEVGTANGRFIIGGVDGGGRFTTKIYKNGCPDNIGGYTFVDTDGNTFASAYDKLNKTYYASSYTKEDGTIYTPQGAVKTSAEMGDMWETIQGFLNKFMDWIMSLFNIKKSDTLADPKNTAPSQADGFTTQEAGLGTWGMALLASAAVGFLLFGEGLKPGKKNK